jgi:hypothetical protein
MGDPYLPEGWTQDAIDDAYRWQAEQRREKAARCRSCGAVIEWAETPKGKRIPVNYDPDPAGNLWLQDVGPRVIAQPVKKGEEPHASVPRYTSHFATCPHAASFRRK